MEVPVLARAGVCALVCAGLLAGCGGSEGGSEVAMLPTPLARELAATSDEVAAALDAGDHCAADELAAALRDDALVAVASGRVPDRLAAQLLEAVDRLDGAIACAPRAEPAAPKPKKPPKPKQPKKKDKKDKKDKDDDDDGDGDGESD